MAKDKLESKLIKNKTNKFGILGGTFDPAHKGHIKISKEAKKRFGLKKVIWAITKKNPFKNKTINNLKARISYAKKLNLKNKYIKVDFFEDKIKSNKTIDLIKYYKRKEKFLNLYFIVGADCLVDFHKWHRWEEILKYCKIIVFDRQNYKSKCLNSLAYKKYNNNGLKFINFKKVNISSSKLRKI